MADYPLAEPQPPGREVTKSKLTSGAVSGIIYHRLVEPTHRRVEITDLDQGLGL